MHAGYLYKRNTPISPPSFQKVYSVLWGTMLLDYDNEEEAKSSLCPKLISEVLGVSEWDGVGRANQYHNGFLIVSHTGGTYYSYVQTTHDRNEWIIHIKRALECNFANPEVIPFKPCKIIQTRPSLTNSTNCAKLNVPITGMIYYCPSCGRGFSSNEYVQESSVFLQLGCEDTEKCCNDCKLSQIVITFLKTLNYYHVTSLHEHTPQVLIDINKYKASFKLRRRISTRLDMAAKLYQEEQSISAEEFEELRQIDHKYRRGLIFEEANRLKEALDTIGNDMQMIIDLLLNPLITERGGRMSYYQIIKSILQLADNEPELIDFYWSQLINVHNIEAAASRSNSSLMKVDLLQQLLLAIAQRYPSSLGIKLAWTLIGTIQDYSDTSKRHIVNQRQFACALSLLLQLELVITGFVSAIGDVNTSKLLGQIITTAKHQKQELGYELGVLFLIRRKLQEVYDEEDRNKPKPNNQNNELELEESKIDIQSSNQQTNQITDHLTDSSTNRITCFYLFLHLGVGPTDTSSRNSSIPTHPIDISTLLWPNFVDQLDFFECITNYIDSLRLVDRAYRTEKLKEFLTKFNRRLIEGTAVGYDPTILTGFPRFKILYIAVDECRVFRTKARAPSLILCITKQDPTENYINRSITTTNPINSSNSELRLSIDEVDGLVNSNIIEIIENIKNNSMSNTIDKQIDRPNSQKLLNHSTRPNTMSRSQSDSLFDHSTSNAITSNTTNNTANNPNKFNLLFDTFKSNHFSNNASTNPSTNLPTNQSNHKTNYVSSNRKSVNFFSLLESVSTEDLPRLTAPPHDSTNILTTNNTFIINNDLEFLNEIVEVTLFPITANQSNTLTNTTTSSSNNLSGQPLVTSTVLVTRKVYESTQKLYNNKKINELEYNQLLLSDYKYRSESYIEEDNLTKERVENKIGENFYIKKDRIIKAYINNELEGLIDSKLDSKRDNKLDSKIDNKIDSKVESSIDSNTDKNQIDSLLDNQLDNQLDRYDNLQLYDLKAFIIKSNDDLRQEIYCMQTILLFKEIFNDLGLDRYLWLQPYQILSTSNSTGLVEVINNTISLDSLKKTDNFTSLSDYFKQTYGTSNEKLLFSKRNFSNSLAAYSLFCYILNIKDRHNGNILIDSEGHLIHIDYGFVLTIAPGGSFSLESCPFKLTEEMVDVLGGIESPLFGSFVKSFTLGFLALRSHVEVILNLLRNLAIYSPFPCYINSSKDYLSILDKIRQRFRCDLNSKEFVKYCLDLIVSSYNNYGTKQYDNFQWYTNGILP